MAHSEVYVIEAKLVLISEQMARDMPAALAHVSAHLELGHHMSAIITDDMEHWARQLAQLRTMDAA